MVLLEDQKNLLMVMMTMMTMMMTTKMQMPNISHFVGHVLLKMYFGATKAETSSTTPQQPEEEDDECPICLEVLPKLPMKYLRNICCGKGIHYACEKKKLKSRSMTFSNFLLINSSILQHALSGRNKAYM